MMRAMLADRFKLKAHAESKQLSVYNLVIANRDGKLGPKMRPLNRQIPASMWMEAGVAARMAAEE